MVILRGQISSAYLLGSQMDSFLSITIMNLADTPMQLACGGLNISQATQYTVRHAGNIPQTI